MSGPIATSDEETVSGELKELVRQTGRGRPERPSRGGGGRPRGLPRRPLRARAHHHLGPDRVQDVEAQGQEVRRGDPRALQEARDGRQGGDDRDALAGVSAGRIEGVSEILWGSSVSAATASNLGDKAFEVVEEWRGRPLAREHPCVFVDGIYLKRAWGRPFENVAAMAAIGVNDDGYRDVIGAAEGLAGSSECWRELLSRLKGRGLSGVRMFTGDKAAAMIGAIAEVFPDAACQRCTAHFYRSVPAKVPKSKRGQAAAMLKAIHARESLDACREKAGSVAREIGGHEAQRDRQVR